MSQGGYKNKKTRENKPKKVGGFRLNPLPYSFSNRKECIKNHLPISSL